MTTIYRAFPVSASEDQPAFVSRDRDEAIHQARESAPGETIRVQAARLTRVEGEPLSVLQIVESEDLQ